MDKASIFDVAKYILQQKGEMTTMKLQKLCYYAQAWSLAWDEIPLFDEDFEAWSNGPVCPVLFAKHKGTFVVNESLFKLSKLTHLELPWRSARCGVPDGESCSNIIEKESMQSYYAGLQSN